MALSCGNEREEPQMRQERQTAHGCRLPLSVTGEKGEKRQVSFPSLKEERFVRTSRRACGNCEALVRMRFPFVRHV